jgi:predicted transcriptional regulator
MYKTTLILTLSAASLAAVPCRGQGPGVKAGPATPTREFQIRNDRPYLGGHPIDIWGLRCSNALYNTAVTERHINNLDNMTAHGLNALAVYIQGSNTGWPVADGALNGFRRDGRLRPEVARRLEWLIREADRRGMVVMVGLISPRKDQDFYNVEAIKRGIEEAGRFLTERKLKNVFVDICHEFDHPERMEYELLRGPDGPAKKARLMSWFKAVAPDIEAGVCPNVDSKEGTTYPGMEVRIIQKQAPIPSEGFVVNVETLCQDQFENDGVFNKGNIEYILADCRRYLDAPNAVMLFHSAHCQGVTNRSGTAPNPEPGGYGTSANDRGIRFYYDWVRDHVGRYEYPRHIRVSPVATSTPASREGQR